MPRKLVKKQSLAPTAASAAAPLAAPVKPANDDNGHDGHDDNDDGHDDNGHDSYENMNPRYAQHPIPAATDADAAAVDTLLSQKITSRIGTYIEEPWSLIGSYFQGKHLDQLVRHQIESYNDFVNYQIQKTISISNR
jgi:hypothetical protein